MGPTDEPPEGCRDARLRRGRLCERLRAEGVDAALVSDRGHFTYLTGYPTPSWENRSRPMALLAGADGSTHAFISEAEAARVALWDEEIVTIEYADPVDPAAPASGPTYAAAVSEAVVAKLSAGQVLATEVAGPSQPAMPRSEVDAIAAAAGARVVDLDRLLWPLRMKKTEFEIAEITAAAAVLAATFDDFALRAAPGMTERDLRNEVVTAAFDAGADSVPYVVVVADANQPMLGAPTDREWREGELLSIDVCLTRHGYWADFCRHYAGSDPSPRQLLAYARLLDGLEVGRQAIEHGRRAVDVAVDVANALGAGTTGFGRLGHGIGLEIAEPPSLHPNDTTELVTGMTLCLEPSAAFDGVGHLVAEEMFAVTPTGGERISPEFPPELEVLSA